MMGSVSMPTAPSTSVLNDVLAFINLVQNADAFKAACLDLKANREALETATAAAEKARQAAAHEAARAESAMAKAEQMAATARAEQLEVQGRFEEADLRERALDKRQVVLDELRTTLESAHQAAMAKLDREREASLVREKKVATTEAELRAARAALEEERAAVDAMRSEYETKLATIRALASA